MWNKLNKSLMVCQLAFGLSFYGVMVILTRFFLEDLKYSEADTMMVVGAFSAIGPLFAIAGGFIADKFLGAYRSLTIAYFSFASGYVLLVIGASSASVAISLSGIALASYARGLMAPENRIARCPVPTNAHMDRKRQRRGKRRRADWAVSIPHVRFGYRL